MKKLPPPPLHFHPASNVLRAELSSTAPPFAFHNKRRTGRRLQGMKYEADVQKMLLEKFPATYLPSPWLRFTCGDKWKWCQPDGLLIDPTGGIVTIVEVKYQHTTDAWWQLRHLYEPVLRHIFPEPLWEFRVVELVKWFDGAIEWPEPTRLIAHVGDSINLPRFTTGVHIWKP